METTWTVLGLECSDGDCCECCGTPCPKRRVVLRSPDGEEVRYGTSCASLKILGSKKAGDQKVITTRARIALSAQKWLAAGHSPEVVATGIWNHYGRQCQAKEGGVDIQGVGFFATKQREKSE